MVVDEMALVRTAELAKTLAQCESNGAPTEEVKRAIRAAMTMGNLALFGWETTQQGVGEGLEGGRARELVTKALNAVKMWLPNIRIAIRIAEQWRAKGPSVPFLEKLQNLENGLQQASAQAEQLLSFISTPPPTLPQDVLERVERAGQRHFSRG